MPDSLTSPPPYRRPGGPWLALGLVLAGAMGAPLFAGRKGRTGARPAAEPKPVVETKAPTIRWIHGRAIHPGADLRNANLRGADLRDCDLTGADLRGADCRGARFAGAVLTSADLRNAQLFNAELSGAVGADLTGADVHPFFALPAGERVGDLDFLRTRMAGEEPNGPPTRLACGADGTLVWHGDPGTPPFLITPTGSRLVFIDGALATTVAIAGDGRNRLWVFTRSTTRVLDMAKLDQAGHEGGVASKSLEFKLDRPPSAMAPGLAGELWITAAPKLIRLAMDGGKGVTYESWKMDPGVLSGNQACVATLGEHGHLAVVEPSRSMVLLQYPGRGSWSVAPLPKGSRPRKVIPGPGFGFTFLQTHPAAVGLIGVRNDACELFCLPDAGPGVEREPWAVTLGPDRNVWYTDRGAGRIGRLTPERKLDEFTLPHGLRPLEIVSCPDGRLYFTVEGRHRIGAIVAVPRVEAKEGAAGPAAAEPIAPGAEAAAPAPSRRGERRRATRAERRAQLEERLQRAEARRLAREAQGETGGAGTAEDAGPAVETKAIPEPVRVAGTDAGAETKPATAAPAGAAEDPGDGPPSPLERLAALGVNLTPGATRHILARHGHGQAAGHSTFHPRFSDPDGLAELLAEGLEACGTLGRVRCTDRAGRYLTLCRRDGVGWRGRYGKAIPTGQFVVVTAGWATEEGLEHDVITAYPVSEDW